MNAQRPGLAVCKGTFAHFAIVKTRDTAQFVIEVPGDQADAALKALGGLPRPGTERWVAVALLNPNHEGGDAPSAQPTKQSSAGESVSDDAPVAASHHGGRGERPKQRWDTMKLARQAGIRCAEPSFQEWLQRHYWTRWQKAVESGPEVNCGEHVAATVVRELCRVESRKHLDEIETAGKTWCELDTEYLIATGQLADPR